MKQFLILCPILIGASSLIGHAVQTDFGAIDVGYIRIVDENGQAVGGERQYWIFAR